VLCPRSGEQDREIELEVAERGGLEWITQGTSMRGITFRVPGQHHETGPRGNGRLAAAQSNMNDASLRAEGNDLSKEAMDRRS